MKRLSRRLVTIGVCATVTLSAWTATAVAHPSVEQRATAAPSRPTPGVGVRKVETVTLVSGDRVAVGIGADGKPTVQDITPRTRPGGAAVTFQTLAHGDSLYVIPSDAAALIGQHRLEMGLFDVGYLAANGYADDVAAHIPLIVQYTAATSTADVGAHARALPTSGLPVTLDSIHAAALVEDKARAGDFWAAVVAPAAPSAHPAAMRGDVARIWLDRKVHVTLDQSVPQIGAPEAWAAGLDGTGETVAILDTGIDTTHPDVAGKVTEEQNFTPDPDAVDHYGHGTHVASIIAGTGAASGGKYKGVAPGAKLMIGKVLSDRGTGDESWIIRGMQWAAQQHARIINMSLGANPTDGTDPMSQAVEQLSAQYGTLFVVAAGNTGPSSQEIQSPGAADAALTVAAVDKSDHLASFSSRGPRFQDHGLKPDIAAPGVSITAARAKGTLLGAPVGEYYTTASGTSMATPHVAGAAAILAEEHPDWTGQQLKTALMSTAHDDGYAALEQGTGRVDVARAFKQDAYATGSVDFGTAPFPHRASITRTVTYTNDTGHSLTLNLDAHLQSFTGQPAPPGLLTLDRAITVPAHGTSATAVTIDPSKAVGAGEFDGTIRASDSSGAVHVTTSIGVYDAPRSSRLTVRIKEATGATVGSVEPTLVLRMDGHQEFDGDPIYLSDGSGSLTLADGPYLVGTYVSWKDAHNTWNSALPVAPQVNLTKDTTVTFDLNKAKKIGVHTPLPTQSYDAWIGYQRTDSVGKWSVVPVVHSPHYVSQNYWMLPNDDRVTLGKFRYVSEHLLGAPLVKMNVRGPGGLALDAWYQDVAAQYPKLAGVRDLPLIYAGRGEPADFADLDVRGKLVLLSLDDICPDACTATGIDRVTNAADAGAAAVVAFGATGRGFLDQGGAKLESRPPVAWPTYPIPTLGLSAAQGRLLVERIVRHSVVVHAIGHPESPYVYALRFSTANRVPSDVNYFVGRSNLVKVTTREHADQAQQVNTVWQPEQADDLFGATNGAQQPYLALTSSAPGTRTEYVGPTNSDTVWGRQFYYSGGASQEALDLFDRPGEHTDDVGVPLSAPGASDFSSKLRAAVKGTDYSADALLCQACRTANTFTPMFNPVDGQGNLSSNPWWTSPGAGGSSAYEQHLYRDGGAEIPLKVARITAQCGLPTCPFTPIPTYPMPAEHTAYRYTLKYSTTDPRQHYGTTIDTAWTFASSPPTASVSLQCWGKVLDGMDPNAPCGAERLLYLTYDTDLGLDNTVAAGTTHVLKVSGYDTWQAAGPTVTSLNLSVTFDDGAHWQRLAARRSGHNMYTAKISSPPIGQTTGAVGIRAHAVDATGNTIDQTVYRAYGLK